MKAVFLLYLTIIVSSFLAINSCKQKKNATSTSATTSAQNNTAATQQQTQNPSANTASSASASTTPQSDNVRFVVAFYSIGQGIDGATHDEFVKFLNSYPKKISYEPMHWGREGETTYCLSLSEISLAEQTEFIQKANSILKKSKLINVRENIPCDYEHWSAQEKSTSENDKFPLVVSFYSMGQGTDLKVKEEFEKFLNSYPKKISYEPIHWGREGETDYCLKLSELSSSEQETFIKKAKEILKKSSLVYVNEQAKCVNKH
jgi:hypothetical protein